LLVFCHIGFLSYRLFVLSAFWYRLFDRRLIPLGFWPRILFYDPSHRHMISREEIGRRQIATMGIHDFYDTTSSKIVRTSRGDVASHKVLAAEQSGLIGLWLFCL
jgi:hypothetical protein